MTVFDFLQHLGKIFFVEQGNSNIAQYLRLYGKDYSFDLQKLIREGAMEEQKLKGYGHTNHPKDCKNITSYNVANSGTLNKSLHASNPNNNEKNSKPGKSRY